LERRIHEHEDKIAIERERFNPDDRLMAHWKRGTMAGSDKSKANENACRGGYESCL